MLSAASRPDFRLFRKNFVVYLRHKFKMKLWALMTIYFSRIDDELSSILQAIEVNHSQAVKLCNQIQADCRKQITKGKFQFSLQIFEQKNFENFEWIFEFLNEFLENQTRMLKTYASKLPTGLEQGDYVVIDFGGRFFRCANLNHMTLIIWLI